MERIRLGRTGLMVSRSGFGAIPIQRINFEEAKKLLRKAYDNGINFFDTARGYTDSEEKIGYALSEFRKDIVIATKSHAKDKKTLLENLETSLKNLKTDYIDIYQLHNPGFVPDAEEAEGLYQTLAEVKKKGIVRFIGFTNHKLHIAMDIAKSEKYDTIQFPLSVLSSERDMALVEECRKRDIGLIAMKGLSGGLVRNVPATFTFLRQLGNVVPIWGLNWEKELDEFLELEKNPPEMDAEMMKEIEQERKELSGSFCRGCGYCLPCPAKIPIDSAARMSFLIARQNVDRFLNDEWKEKMSRINSCINCGACKSRCPYELDTPNLLKQMLVEYEKVVAAHNG